MVITFATREIRNLCEIRNEAESKFGERIAQNLRNRLADISSASTVSDLLAGDPRADGEDYYKVSISENQNVVFTQSHNPPRCLSGGASNWQSIKRVKIVSIGPDE